MSKVTSTISEVEQKWFHLLSDYDKGKFSKVNIPSHDHNHHLRVWGYAKQIFTELDSYGYKVNSSNIEKAIIAVFFHDVGLTKTLDEIAHGAEGRKMCEEFFRQKKLKEPKDFSEVLNAVEHHVDKKYQARVYENKLAKDNVFSILCVADDLDAFGMIGVLRYAEIYLLRDSNMETLAERVLKNLNSRFENFRGIYGDLRNLVEKQKERYLVTRNFYQNLEKELKK